jgi:hypothetical protein
LDEFTGRWPDVFEVGYVAEDGLAYRVELTDVWPVQFEAMASVRRFGSRKVQRHLPAFPAPLL